MNAKHLEARPWVDFYDEHVPITLDYPRTTLPRLFMESTARNAKRTAMSFMGHNTDFATLESSANAVAEFLLSMDVQKGDRVLMLLPNCPQFAIVYYAIHKVGAVVVPASPLDTAPELAYKVRDSGARLIFFLDLLFDKIQPLSDDPQIRRLISCDLADYLPFPKSVLFSLRKRFLPVKLPQYKKLGDGCIRYKEILSRFSTKMRHSCEQLKSEDLAVLIYTGGTTGVSKGVMLSHYALIVNLTQASNWGQVGPEDSYLCVLPFFHGFGMSIGLNTSLVHGARLELMPRWDVRQTIRHMASGKVTLFAGVPTMYVAILNHPDFKKLSGTKLRGCYVGAAPVPESLKEEFHRKTGGILIEGYGLTEAVTAKSANPMNGLKKEKSIGIPWPDTIFQIVDDEGRPLPANEPGEIRIQSPDLMMGYWENPEATSECMRDGWLYTGDIGYMDSDGYFYIVDRKKDLIISGGYNVYPSEVEEVIYSHEDVLEASVIGIPDAKKGESVKAFVVTVSGSHLNETALNEYLAARLIKYKLPASIEFRESLPKSPIGKILKKELAREELDRLQNA